MTIGIALHLPSNAEASREVIQALEATHGIILEVPRGDWLPLSFYCGDQTEAKLLHRRLESMPGVRAVEVACVEFDGASEEFISQQNHQLKDHHES